MSEFIFEKRYNSKTDFAVTPLESKLDPDKRAVESQVLEGITVIKIPVHIPVGQDEIEPLEPVADAPKHLPGRIRTSGADVRVVGQIPFLIEINVPSDTDNAVPPGA